ncbi:MAG: HAMP domain-containing histidine kinase [Candidatus Delongbacteria bacterium]|nr:HAMP domain-containing histidine kinase [Candidatus Delongbacteria bacterium]MBN2834262.1 HAMP domain-containing histidine kinase [Candidatus Delongbacteria bacterium]
MELYIYKDGKMNPLLSNRDEKNSEIMKNIDFELLKSSDELFFENKNLVLKCIYSDDCIKLFSLDYILNTNFSDNEITRLVIHNLNNIITSIHTNSYLALKQNDNSAIESIYKLSDSAVKISRKYLFYNLQKKSWGKQKFKAYEVITDCMEIFKNKIESENISYEILENCERFFLFMNISRFYQIIVSLITNSLEALKGEEKPQLKIILEKKVDCMSITVFDNGKGIEDSIINKIFEPGFTTKDSGNGFGLTAVKEFVEFYNGKINVRSDVKNKETYVEIQFYEI